MKLRYSFISAMIIAVAFIVGCEQDPTSNERMPNLPMAAKGSPSTDINPAWVFWDLTYVKGKLHKTIAVSDVDGTDRTHIYTASNTTNMLFFSTWSANGESVSFVEMPALVAGSGWFSKTQWGNYYLKAVDLSIAGGKIAARNERTIFSVTASDQMKIVAQAWCPATSGPGAGKIAFTAYTPTQSRIYLIDAAGGTPTLIYSVSHADDHGIHGNSLTWSADGTKLAFDLISGINTTPDDMTYAIKIIDLSGTVLTTLIEGTHGYVGNLQWSNTGLNQLTYIGTDVVPSSSATTSDWNTYVIGTTVGSTPTKLFSGTGNNYGIYWSPDNTELVYRHSDGYTYLFNIALATSTRVGNVQAGDWK